MAADLAPHDIHLWCCDLDQPEQAPCSGVLSAAERARAGRYRTDRDRKRFTAGRTFIRRVLSCYGDSSPEQLEFAIGAAGKPRLESCSSIHFNYSDADGVGVLAVSRSEVGVDIERIAASVDCAAIAGNFFCGAEIERILAVPTGQMRELFFRHWVAKEAVIKAQGSGLQTRLDAFEVEDLRAGAKVRVKAAASGLMRQDWHVEWVSCEPGWQCAVAAAGEHWQVIVRNPHSVIAQRL